MKQSLGNSSFDQTFFDPDPNHQTVRGIFFSFIQPHNKKSILGDILTKWFGMYINTFFPFIILQTMNIISWQIRQKHYWNNFYCELDWSEKFAVGGNKFANLKPIRQILGLGRHLWLVTIIIISFELTIGYIIRLLIRTGVSINFKTWVFYRVVFPKNEFFISKNR